MGVKIWDRPNVTTVGGLTGTMRLVLDAINSGLSSDTVHATFAQVRAFVLAGIGYCNSGSWSPTWTDTAGVLTITPAGGTQQRIGKASNNGAAALGDVVTLHVACTYTGTIDATPVVEISGLPYPVDPAGTLTWTSSGLFEDQDQLIISTPDPDIIRFAWFAPTGGPVNGALIMHVTYQVGTP